MSEISCPVCTGEHTEVFLERRQVPVQQNFLATSRARAIGVARGDLQMRFCNSCGFVFNASYRPELLQYDADYNNTQESSDYFRQHLESLKNKLVNEHGCKNSVIAEIGCGKGFFLKMLVLDESLDNRGFGFDPSYEGEETLGGGRLRFIKKYFDSNCRGFNADVLLCRHVIEHVARPFEFLSGLRTALGESPACRLFFETPCGDWIFENLTIWDFFYEHCSIFTEHSISCLFNRAGFKVDSLAHVFGGQYLWLEASMAANREIAERQNAISREKMLTFAAFERDMVARWQQTVRDLKAKGPVGVWGAGAKGVTFVNLLDKNCEAIDLLVDVNPDKHGRFVPGTGHPVVGCEQIAASGIKNLIVMNPNYLAEVSALLKRSGIKVNLIIEPGGKNENSN